MEDQIWKLLDGFIPPVGPNFNTLKIMLEREFPGWLCDKCDQPLPTLANKIFFHFPLEGGSSDDYCLGCFPRAENKEKFFLADTGRNDLHVIGPYLTRPGVPRELIVSLAPVRFRWVAEGMGVFLSEGRARWWLKSIENLWYVPNDFGSLLGWAPISDPYEIPFVPADTFLLLDTSHENFGRVASGVVDSHGKIVLNVVYHGARLFLKELKEWEGGRPTGLELEAAKEVVREKIKETNTCSHELLREIVLEFSAYVRLKKDLPYCYSMVGLGWENDAGD